MSLSNENNPTVIVVNVGTLSTAGDIPVCNLPRRFVLQSVKLLDQAGIAASDTNYVTLTLKQGSTSIASLDTRAANQGAVTALVAKDFDLADAYDDEDSEPVAAGDLKLTYAEGGTGTTTLAQLQLSGYWK